MEPTVDEISQQVAEIIVDSIEGNNEAILECIESDLKEDLYEDAIDGEDETIMEEDTSNYEDTINDEGIRNFNVETKKLFYDYLKLQEINDKLLTKSLKQDEIKNLNNLFKNLNKIPKISLLGQSGAGKSTLINKIVNESVLESSSGKGAVTQFPVELVYGETTRFNITKIDEELYEIKSIVDDKSWLSNRDILDDFTIRDIISRVSDFIDGMNKWEIPYSEKKKKFLWKEFNKKIAGNIGPDGKDGKDRKDKKYHFEYKNTINGKDVCSWVNVSPFIKKISFWFNCNLLKSVTLVDLPGLYDKSEVRTRKTKEYLDNETDFIMIVENNDRAATSSFIDKSLNSYIINIVVKKQIPDILLVLTNIDRTYDDCIEEAGEEDSDSDDEDIMDNAKSEFLKRIENTRLKITEDIEQNPSLKTHNITKDNINIQFYSSKGNIGNISDFKVSNIITSINNICETRVKRYSDMILNIIRENYHFIKGYVNKDSIQEEEIEKIKQILSLIKKDIVNDITVKSTYKDLMVEDREFTDILTFNEEYSNRLRNRQETHGLTLWATLRKLYHESNDGTVYNIVEDLSEEYVKFWKIMYNDFIKDINSKYWSNNKVIDDMVTFEKLKEINGVDVGDITDFKKRIRNIFNNGNSQIIINYDVYNSYENYLKTTGLKIIEDSIRKNILIYHYKAINLSGEGSSSECRKYISEMLSISKNKIVKDSINKKIVTILNEINEKNHKSFNEKLDDIFKNFCEQYEEGYIIDVDGINQLLEEMNDYY